MAETRPPLPAGSAAVQPLREGATVKGGKNEDLPGSIPRPPPPAPMGRSRARNAAGAPLTERPRD